MLNKIKTFIAVAVLSGTVSANVQAATVTAQKGDNLKDLPLVFTSSEENTHNLNQLQTDLIRPRDVLNNPLEKQYSVKQGGTLRDIPIKHHINRSLPKEWDKLIPKNIYPELNLLIFDDLNTSHNDITDKTMKSTPPTVSDQEASKTKSSKPVTQVSKPAAKVTKKSAPVVKAVATKKTVTVKATAYTASCEGCSGTTATGINIKANPHAKVIAVDPSVIPLGSKVYVEGFGEATAADTGGAIKGNRIDVFIPSEQDAINFGVKKLKVKILN
ncbi:3D domain-containing protein [Bacillus sp. CGMCC 1.16607]|uniref:LysM peptidoglycan-binding and 3D domain-containing protein n=1 Tax=Bacillus sp. CGMCC 1.16607 TaxID=3351842 RepID=UPI00362DAABD